MWDYYFNGMLRYFEISIRCGWYNLYVQNGVKYIIVLQNKTLSGNKKKYRNPNKVKTRTNNPTTTTTRQGFYEKMKNHRIIANSHHGNHNQSPPQNTHMHCTLYTINHLNHQGTTHHVTPHVTPHVTSLLPPAPHCTTRYCVARGTHENVHVGPRPVVQCLMRRERGGCYNV